MGAKGSLTLPAHPLGTGEVRAGRRWGGQIDMWFIRGEDRWIFSSSGRNMSLHFFFNWIGRCVLPVLSPKRVEKQSVILAAYESGCGFLCISQLAGWYIKLMA